MDDIQNQQKTNSPINSGANVPVPNITAEELKKKMDAILAMEGEEGKARREREEQEKKEAGMVAKYEQEKSELNKKIADIAKAKEDLELRWIDLSGKKMELQKILDPILAGEANAEKDIQAKNQEEHATDDIRLRQGFEKERQALEATRENYEKEKWVIEDKELELEKGMTDNKAKYQELLKEEYSIVDKIKEIDKNIESVKK